MATVTPRKKRCFVVMGFGKKTDYATGRQIDMDKTYRVLIQPVIKDLDLECVRADEIRHTGVIDVPMYWELLNADVVLADLSTANLNATYELGVRHALRPSTTVVISENRLAYPFDVNHIAITSYALLDGGIDVEEVDRFREVLKDKIKSVLEDPKTDSPVYTYLRLSPPSLQQETAETLAAGGAAGAVLEPASRASAPLTRGLAQMKPPTLAQLTREGEEAIRNYDFSSAREKFAKALELTRQHADRARRRAAAEPLPASAARVGHVPVPEGRPGRQTERALELLRPLNLRQSNDPETVRLAGAIEKRLYENGQGTDHLARALKYYERGYVLRNDFNSGINLAYMMNVRADSALDPTEADRIADMVYANRVRREVLQICDAELRALSECERKRAAAPKDRAPIRPRTNW